jgi:hypothetical protein
MIQSELECSVAKEQLEFLRKSRDAVFERNEGSPFMMHLAANGFERMMTRLQLEIDEYESRSLETATPQGR